MGNYDKLNYIINVKTKWDFSDQRIVSFLRERDYGNFLFDDYVTFRKKFGDNITSKYSEQIINFFIIYKQGILLPDKFNYYEPVKWKFVPTDLILPRGCLSEPAGELYLKKRYIYQATITNHSFGVIGQQDTPKSPCIVMKPVVALPELMGEVKFWFYKSKKPTTQEQIDFYVQLMWDLKDAIEGEEGYVRDEELGEIIAQFKNNK